jgi:hypothetical protein
MRSAIRAASLMSVVSVRAASEPSFDVFYLVVDLPFFAVSAAHQANKLGLNNNSFSGGNAHESTVAPKYAQCNQRRLLYSCNNRVIDKLN